MTGFSQSIVSWVIYIPPLSRDVTCMLRTMKWVEEMQSGTNRVPTSESDLSVVIVGAGVVGVATGRGLAAVGTNVAFYDTSAQRTVELRANGLNVWDEDDLRGRECDAYLISVPTPTRNGRIDLSAVQAAAELVGVALANAPRWSCVVVRSTVPPGTTEEVVLPLLEKYSGKKAGRDFGLAMNPEFLRAVSAEEDFVNPRVIVFGVIDRPSSEFMRRLYLPWSHVTTKSVTLREAEATKYVANVFNAAKISFFNEMHSVLEKMGIESMTPFLIAAMGAEGLWNPVYGTKGGNPFGGECLPKDTAAFATVVRDLGVDAPMLEATIATNVRLFGIDFLGPFESDHRPCDDGSLGGSE